MNTLLNVFFALVISLPLIWTAEGRASEGCECSDGELILGTELCATRIVGDPETRCDTANGYSYQEESQMCRKSMGEPGRTYSCRAANSDRAEGEPEFYLVSASPEDEPCPEEVNHNRCAQGGSQTPNQPAFNDCEWDSGEEGFLCPADCPDGYRQNIQSGLCEKNNRICPSFSAACADNLTLMNGSCYHIESRRGRLRHRNAL